MSLGLKKVGIKRGNSFLPFQIVTNFDQSNYPHYRLRVEHVEH